MQCQRGSLFENDATYTGPSRDPCNRRRHTLTFKFDKRISCVLSVLFFIFSILSPVAASSGLGEEVDVALVLAVDISYSMDSDEQRLQRKGYVEAITSPHVVETIRDGLIGKIALAYVEWAGTFSQSVIVDWMVIGDAASARRFADALIEAPLSRAYRTSISEALLFSGMLHERNPHPAHRRVIDISGDGPNNQGILVVEARDTLVDRGIVINGLPLLLKRPIYGWFDIENLDRYYLECVIGGPAAFAIPVREAAAFGEAIRRKLVLEIAGPPDDFIDRPRFLPAATAEDNPLCTVGERLWRQRRLDGR